MSEFAPAVEKLLRIEGGFSQSDNRAGAVNFGITQSFLRLIGYEMSVDEVRAMTRHQAEGLYRRYFWDGLRIGEIRDQRVAEAYFISAVNLGPAIPCRYLQLILNRLGQSVDVDGTMGSETIDAINDLNEHDTVCLLGHFRNALLHHYEGLAKANLYADDLGGWVNRLDVVFGKES